MQSEIREFENQENKFPCECLVQVAMPSPLQKKLLLNPIEMHYPCGQAAAFTLHKQRDGQVSIRVYDYSGRLVSIVHEGYLPAGRHSIPFRTVNFCSGVYCARLEAGEAVLLEKVILLR